MTASPNPNPAHGCGSPPKVSSSLSYRPPPAMARSSPRRSNASNTTPAINPTSMPLENECYKHPLPQTFDSADLSIMTLSTFHQCRMLILEMEAQLLQSSQLTASSSLQLHPIHVTSVKKQLRSRSLI